MLRLFRSTHPAVYVLLLLFTGLLRGKYLLMPPLPEEVSLRFSFAGQYLWPLLHGRLGPQFWQLTDALLIFAGALTFNYLLRVFQLAEKGTRVPAMLFILLSSLFGEWMQNGVQTPALLLSIVVFYHVLSFARHELSREHIFYSGFFLSLACLLYFPALIWLPVLLYGLFLQSYAPRDFALLLIGLVLPVYFLGIYFYYIDALPDYLRFWLESFQRRAEVPRLPLPEFLFAGLVVALSFYGRLQLPALPGYKVIKLRRQYRIFGLALIVAPVGAAFVIPDVLPYLQLLAIPATVMLSAIFDKDELPWWKSMLFYLLLAGVGALQAREWMGW